MIPFNKPYITHLEKKYIEDVFLIGKFSGNRKYAKKCQDYFKSKFLNQLNLCTTSCTDALEMSALLCNIKPGDEVIIPTFTFVSTANAFMLRGAKIKFVDSRNDHPGIDESKIEEIITKKTKAIVVVHYAGVSCDMNKILDIAKKHNLLLIEDAAHAIDSYYYDKPLGSIGDMGTFSFHETKNIHCGEGGMLSINNKIFSKRAEIIWEKGTNRSAFWRGEVDKYNWIDVGSSFLPSELNTSFLYAQLENMTYIQSKRLEIWNKYYEGLANLKSIGLRLPNIPSYATNNAHLFYMVCRDGQERAELIEYLKHQHISAVFHYICLHDSPYFKDKHDGREMANAKKYENCLVRLPLWVEISSEQISKVIQTIKDFYFK